MDRSKTNRIKISPAIVRCFPRARWQTKKKKKNPTSEKTGSKVLQQAVFIWTHPGIWHHCCQASSCTFASLFRGPWEICSWPCWPIQFRSVATTREGSCACCILAVLPLPVTRNAAKGWIVRRSGNDSSSESYHTVASQRLGHEGLRQCRFMNDIM